MIKTLSSNRNIYIFPDASCTSVRAYMEATLLVRLAPFCAKDDDRAPVRRAIWKPTPKIFGVTLTVFKLLIKIKVFQEIDMGLTVHALAVDLTKNYVHRNRPYHLPIT